MSYASRLCDMIESAMRVMLEDEKKIVCYDLPYQFEAVLLALHYLEAMLNFRIRQVSGGPGSHR